MQKTKTVVIEFSITREQAANRTDQGWDSLARNIGEQNITPLVHRFRVVASEEIRAYFQTPDDLGAVQWSSLDHCRPFFEHIDLGLGFDFAVGEAFRMLALRLPHQECANGAIRINLFDA